MYKITKEGSGEKCGPAKFASTLYTGKLINGDIFDASERHIFRDPTTRTDLRVAYQQIRNNVTIRFKGTYSYAFFSYVVFDLLLVDVKCKVNVCNILSNFYFYLRM